MGALVLDISMSVDGFVAGPEQTLEGPLGRGGERLHDWAINSAGWRAAHGHEGGDQGPDSDVAAQGLDGIGAVIMGRNMFTAGRGEWDES